MSRSVNMDKVLRMAWYSIRAIYEHAPESDGMRLYEERMLLFRAQDIETAFALAENESRQYLTLNPTFERVGEWVAFAVAASENGLEGTEIWSGLSRSSLTGHQYYERRYTAYELQPSEGDEVG